MSLGMQEAYELGVSRGTINMLRRLSDERIDDGTLQEIIEGHDRVLARSPFVEPDPIEGFETASKLFRGPHARG